MVERSDTTGHRSPSPSASWRGASQVPPPALASLPGCGGSLSRGSPVVLSLRSSTTGYKLGSLLLHGGWTPRSLRMRPPEPMPRSAIRFDRALASRLPPLMGLWSRGLSNPDAGIWVVLAGYSSARASFSPGGPAPWGHRAAARSFAVLRMHLLRNCFPPHGIAPARVVSNKERPRRETRH